MKILCKSRRLFKEAKISNRVKWVEEEKLYALEKLSQYNEHHPMRPFVECTLVEIEDELQQLYEEGGKQGAKGEMEQLEATKEIAFAAAFFAIAGIFVGASSLIIALFGG